MKNANNRKPPKAMLIALIAAAVILAASTIGGARAALSIKSDEYVTQFEMYHIGITLNENDTPLVWRNYKDEAWHVDQGTYDKTARLLENMQALDGTQADEFAYGTTYKEVLTVTNSGAIDEYVRVTIRKYWLLPDGTEASAVKNTDLDPSMIDLHILADGAAAAGAGEDAGNGWVVDQSMNDPERTVLYYTSPLSIGETSPAFTDTLTVDGAVKSFVTQSETKDEDGYTVVTNIYTYDGAVFCIDVEADGVQTHSARDAISSAWGRAVVIDENGILHLK